MQLAWAAYAYACASKQAEAEAQQAAAAGAWMSQVAQAQAQTQAAQAHLAALAAGGGAPPPRTYAASWPASDGYGYAPVPPAAPAAPGWRMPDGAPAGGAAGWPGGAQAYSAPAFAAAASESFSAAHLSAPSLPLEAAAAAKRVSQPGGKHPTPADRRPPSAHQAAHTSQAAPPSFAYPQHPPAGRAQAHPSVHGWPPQQPHGATLYIPGGQVQPHQPQQQLPFPQQQPMEHQQQPMQYPTLTQAPTYPVPPPMYAPPEQQLNLYQPPPHLLQQPQPPPQLLSHGYAPQHTPWLQPAAAAGAPAQYTPYPASGPAPTAVGGKAGYGGPSGTEGHRRPPGAAGYGGAAAPSSATIDPSIALPQYGLAGARYDAGGADPAGYPPPAPYPYGHSDARASFPPSAPPLSRGPPMYDVAVRVPAAPPAPGGGARARGPAGYPGLQVAGAPADGAGPTLLVRHLGPQTTEADVSVVYPKS